MNSNEIDPATVAICEGKPILGRWSYTLDTSNDDNYPHISYGQLLLRGDGVVFQHVHYSGPKEFGPWHIAPRARDGGPFTVADVERIYSWPSTDYSIVRIAGAPTPSSTDQVAFPMEFHSDVDGDRYVIVDPDNVDLSGWSLEVGQDENWRKQAGFGGWTPERDSRTFRREFTREHPWYRSDKGSSWGYLRFSKDEVEHPWSAMIDHGERIFVGSRRTMPTELPE